MARAMTASAPAATSAQSDSAASSEETFGVTRYSVTAAFQRCRDRASDARLVVRPLPEGPVTTNDPRTSNVSGDSLVDPTPSTGRPSTSHGRVSIRTRSVRLPIGGASLTPASRKASPNADTARDCVATSDVPPRTAHCISCLLYTSDAADDLLCVDLGGRRIIKK